MALRDYLGDKAKKIHARILVSAGHIHNYERHEQANITYLVSGGGGAFPGTLWSAHRPIFIRAKSSLTITI